MHEVAVSQDTRYKLALGSLAGFGSVSTAQVRPFQEVAIGLRELPPTTRQERLEEHEMPNRRTDPAEVLASGMSAEVHLCPFHMAASSASELRPVRTKASPTHRRTEGHDNAVSAGTLRG
jgi:hypothetical protein